MKAITEEKWEWEIKPQTSWLGGSVSEVLSYKDLLFRLVRKEFLASYQQTLLGPLWMLINPLLIVLTYDLIFEKIIGVSTEGIPSFAYYLVGITLWNLFSDVLLSSANTFSENAEVFSKVYFPRIIAPLSNVLLQCLRSLIQMMFVVIVVMYYRFNGKIDVGVANMLIALPVIVVTCGMALGAGLIFSILTAMYRDLSNLIGITMRMLMFLCPIFYSQSIVPEKMKWLMNINPISSLFELFRFAFLGKGYLAVDQMIYTVVFTICLLTIGILLFNKMGDKLMDVV